MYSLRIDAIFIQKQMNDLRRNTGRDEVAVSSYPIMVLAEMIEEFDIKQPKPGRETTAFIKRWRAKELEEEHSSQHHLQMAIRGINRAEIQNIRETKHFRDKQRQKKSKKWGSRGGKVSTAKRKGRTRLERFTVEIVG